MDSLSTSPKYLPNTSSNLKMISKKQNSGRLWEGKNRRKKHKKDHRFWERKIEDDLPFKQIW